MGIRETFMNMFGGGDRGAEAPTIDVPPVSELLAPTKIMEKEWIKAARDDAREYGDMTRAELGREFGARWFVGTLPAAPEERRSAIEDRLLDRSHRLYAEHLEEVQKVFDLPDAEARGRLMFENGDLPGRDRAHDRALHISTAILGEEAYDREMDLRAREMEEDRRMSPPLDWSEHKAGEPGILAAERDGDWEHVDHGRRVYLDSFQLRDPTLREIAMTVVDKADAWSSIDAGDLASGQVRLDERTAERMRSSAATYEPGRRRDSALVEAYLDDYAARNTKVVETWNRQALEVMSEGPAFMRARYGGTDTDGMSVRQIVSLEAMRAVTQVRMAQDMDQTANVGLSQGERIRDVQPDGSHEHVRSVSLPALGVLGHSPSLG